MFLLTQNITVFLKYKKKISGHIALTNIFFVCVSIYTHQVLFNFQINFLCEKNYTVDFL